MPFMAGTRIFGQVRIVEGTSVVTKFATFQSLPIFPLRSYYLAGTVDEKVDRLFFFGTKVSSTVEGYYLARLDYLSVGMTYFLLLCEILLYWCAVGFVLELLGMRRGRFFQVERDLLPWLLGILLGVAGGWLSRQVPLTTQRERAIRLHCGKVLGYCIDPARLALDDLFMIEQWIEASNVPVDLHDQVESRITLTLNLITCRAEIARGNLNESKEEFTDELLRRLASLST